MWAELVIPGSAGLKCGGRNCLFVSDKTRVGTYVRQPSLSSGQSGARSPRPPAPACAPVDVPAKWLLYSGEPGLPVSLLHRPHCLGNRLRVLGLEIPLMSVFIL